VVRVAALVKGGGDAAVAHQEERALSVVQRAAAV
jgi:hypothetical protein